MPTVLAPGAPLVRRLAVLAAGIALVAIGVAVTIHAELGVAPYDVVTTGMHEQLGLALGLAAIVLPVVFVGIGVLCGGRIGAGTVVCTLAVGPVLGVVDQLLPRVEPLLLRIPMFAAGFCSIAAGVVLCILPELGAGPAEVLMLAIADRGRPLAPVRTGIEAGCVVVGFGMGGQVGVGTLAFAGLIGPALRRLLTLAGYDDRAAATRSDTASPGA
jgi:uncharacterized membrane protein YczE